MNSTNLVFLISLPRSGSTLLQRILSNHQEISTLSEPWLMLPLCYLQKDSGIYTEYNHGWARRALHDFIHQLPNQQHDFSSALRSFAQQLYGLSNPLNSKYFLEKTPRYYLIIPEIHNIFPNAKYIFLFRNPLQIFSSIIESACNNRFLLHEYIIDLHCGPSLLAEGYNFLKAQSHAVYFDELVTNPEIVVQQIFDYLDLSYAEETVKNFHNNFLYGQMGDKSKSIQYKQIETDVTEKWRIVLNNRFRKYMAKRYINSLSSNVLFTFGLDKANILKAIDHIDIKNKRLLTDIVYFSLGTFYRLFEAPMFVNKIRNRKRDKSISFLMHR